MYTPQQANAAQLLRHLLILYHESPRGVKGFGAGPVHSAALHFYLAWTFSTSGR